MSDLENITTQEIRDAGVQSLTSFLAALGTHRESVGGCNQTLHAATLRKNGRALITQARELNLPARFISSLIEASKILFHVSDETRTYGKRIEADRLYCEVYNALYHGMRDSQ